MTKTTSYTEKWQCEQCSTVHDDEDDAQDCCRPHVRTVLVCDSCAKQFPERKVSDAERCHPDGVIVPRCLCGNFLSDEDERPSEILGTIVMCEQCRAKVLAGIPTGEAVRETFRETFLSPEQVSL